MKNKYFFDTGFLTLALTESLPEKWGRPWDEVKGRLNAGCIIEPVIAEAYRQLMRRGMNKEEAKDCIMRVKSADSINILNLNDNDSFKAGLYYTRFRQFRVSYIDCFVLAVADRFKLKIYTTDRGVRRSAREINVLCDCLPV